MANTVTSFYQTLVAAMTEACQALAPTWNASGSIYVDYKPEAATIGQTLNVPIPTDPTSSVADVGVGDFTLTDIAFSTQAIVFNKHPGFGYVIRDFEQFNSPTAVRNVFLDAALKGVKSNINAAVTALFVTGNFTTNTAISATGGAITVTQFLQGMAALSDQKVPVANDPANVSLILPSVPYTKMMDSTTATTGAAWVQAFIAGNRTADAVRLTGELPTSFGMTVKLDQQMPVSGTAPARTFTGAYIHRWAVALATRPLPPPDGKVVDFSYADFGGIPIRVQLGYNQLKGGYVVTIDAGYGIKVVRENMGQLFTIAE